MRNRICSFEYINSQLNLSDLKDVDGPPADNDTLQYDLASGLWETKKVLDSLTLNSPIIAGDYAWTGDSTLTISDNLKEVVFGAGLLFSEGGNNWLDLDSTGNTIEFGNIDDDQAFIFLGDGAFTKSGTGTASFGGDLDVSGTITGDVVVGELYLDGGSLITATTVTTTTGTHSDITDGVTADTHTVNGVYYTVTELAGGYPVLTIDIDFVLDSEPGKIIVVGKYVGSVAHSISAQAWNYTTLAWDNFTAVDDFPSTTTDQEYDFDYSDLPGVSSDYLSGTASRFRIDHTSNGISSHYFDLDYIAVIERSFTIAAPGTFYVITGLTEGKENNTTLDGTNGTITIVKDGTYLVNMAVSFAGTDGARFRGNLFVDGVRQGNLGAGRKLGTDGDVGTTCFTGLIDLVAGEVVDLRVASNMAGDYASIQNLNWNLTRQN